MRPALFALLLTAAAPALAHEDPDDLVLATGSDLLAWCKDESAAHLIGQGQTPANWTATHYEKVNTLIVEGKWSVDGVRVEVECRVARGARAQFAWMKMSPN